MITVAYQKSAAYLLVGAGVIAMPEMVFHLLLELAHLVLEAAHLLFELVESALDHLVEHHFHTDTRETQIIVFYIILTIGLGLGYFLWRLLKRWAYAYMRDLKAAWLDCRLTCLNYWAESAHNKFKLIAGVNIGLTVAYLVCF